MSQPLLFCLKLFTLVGEVLTAVTMDRVVCTANVRQKGQVVGWGRLGGLKVRNKGDVLEMVVEEDYKILRS